MKATIVIPAYNESSRIEACIRNVAHWAHARPGGWDRETILVDDGSTDDTVAKARRVADEEKLDLRVISYGANRGKGAAIREGVLASTGDPLLISDTGKTKGLTG